MKNKQKNELAVCGIEAVKSLAKYNPEKITRLYFTVEKAPLFSDLCKKLAQNRIPYNVVEHKNELEKLAGSVHHQGVVAMITAPQAQFVTKNVVEQWVNQKETILVLDMIGNANNFGAIIRSAAFFGFSHIIISEKEAQAGISTATYRTAQGGMEFVTVYTVKSLPLFLHDVKGKLLVVGTDSRGTKTIREFSTFTSKSKQGSILIFGNEEEGLSPTIKKLCDVLVSIPRAHDTTQNHAPQVKKTPFFMDSLNVAQAASIILYEMSLVN